MCALTKQEKSVWFRFLHCLKDWLRCNTTSSTGISNCIMSLSWWHINYLKITPSCCSLLRWYNPIFWNNINVRHKVKDQLEGKTLWNAVVKAHGKEYCVKVRINNTVRNRLMGFYFAIWSVPAKLLFEEADLLGNASRYYIIHYTKSETVCNSGYKSGCKTITLLMFPLCLKLCY